MADFLGARSQIFSFVSAIVVILTILFLGPVFYYLPRVCMSAIIITAAYSLVELHDFIFLWSIRVYTFHFLSNDPRLGKIFCFYFLPLC